MLWAYLLVWLIPHGFFCQIHGRRLFWIILYHGIVPHFMWNVPYFVWNVPYFVWDYTSLNVGFVPHFMWGLYLILCGIVPIINALRCKAMSLQQYIVILVRIWLHDGICWFISVYLKNSFLRAFSSVIRIGLYIGIDSMTFIIVYNMDESCNVEVYTAIFHPNKIFKVMFSVSCWNKKCRNISIWFAETKSVTKNVQCILICPFYITVRLNLFTKVCINQL